MASKKPSAKKKAKKKKVAKKKVQKNKSAKPKTAKKPAAFAPANLGLAAAVSEFRAVNGCLDQVDAAELVFSCAGREVDGDTTLGTLFPSDTVRQGFCGCVFSKAVAAGVNIQPGGVPCGKGKTILDVIDSISC
jgi:hypothetical protein